MKNRKIIITTLVVSLLSFGMIDSPTTKSRTSETNWERMVKEEEIRKETEEFESNNITKMKWKDF